MLASKYRRSQNVLLMEVLTSPAESAKPDISLEARISFADLLEDHSEWMHASAIAETLDTYDNKVSRIAEALNIPYELRLGANGRDVMYYPPYAAGVLKEEIDWRQTYRDLPSAIPLRTIQEHVGRSFGWTQGKLDELGIYANNSSLYLKSALREVRRISMAVPLDNGWYNLRQLVLYSSADREWIERRLDEISLLPEKRRSSLTGKILTFYPPESVSELMKAIESRAEPGGEWLTAHAITEKIDRSYNWIRNRLKEHSTLAVKKQDDHGVTRDHYSPSIVGILADESARIRALPELVEHLNIHQVARRLGHGTNWAIQILNKMGIEPEEGRDKLGRPQKGYSGSILEQIKNYEEANPPDERRVTPAELLDGLFAIGSLRSRIILQRDFIATSIEYGCQRDDERIVTARAMIRMLYHELKMANQRQQRALNRASDLPGFISGLKTPSDEGSSLAR